MARNDSDRGKGGDRGRDKGGDRDRGRDRGDRGRGGGRGRGRDREDPKARMEKEFTREMQMRITYFLDSPEEELVLEPMNSFRRRMVHTLAKEFNLESESRGEEHDRHVALVKTGEAAPPKAPASKVRLWDYGTQTFKLNLTHGPQRIALKVDGGVEIFRESEKASFIADRMVEGKEFRIRKGKILFPGEEGY